MQFWEGERNERFYKLAAQFSNGRPARNYSDPINGGLCVPVGRHIEIRLSESRRWTIYEARISSAVFHCDRRRLVRDHRRLVATYRVFDTADRGAVYDRLQTRPTNACFCTLAIHAPYRRRAQNLITDAPAMPWIVLTDEPNDFI